MLLKDSRIIENLQVEVRHLKEMVEAKTVVKDAYQISELPLSKVTIWKHMKAGRLKVLKVGGRNLVLRSDWLKFIKSFK